MTAPDVLERRPTFSYSCQTIDQPKLARMTHIVAGQDKISILGRLDEREEALVAFGRRLAGNAKDISDEAMNRITAFLTPEQVVTLTAFGAMMVATNIFINALDVDLDEYLFAYRKA